MRLIEITAYLGPMGKYLNRGSHNMLYISLAFSTHSVIKITMFVYRTYAAPISFLKDIKSKII